MADSSSTSAATGESEDRSDPDTIFRRMESVGFPTNTLLERRCLLEYSARVSVLSLDQVSAQFARYYLVEMFRKMSRNYRRKEVVVRRRQIVYQLPLGAYQLFIRFFFPPPSSSTLSSSFSLFIF